MVAAKRLKATVETQYLREFARSYLSEVAFRPRAEMQMRSQGVTLTGVHHVMRTGDVAKTEKEDAEGTVWTVVGETCDDDRLRIQLEVFYDRYQMVIVDVRKIERKIDG